MAREFSQLAILEGNENCIPVTLGSGQVVEIPSNYFHTELYPIEDVLDHDDKHLLNGIVQHFNNEGLLVGEDGFIYASTNPDDYEPIALLDGDELGKGGFKFKMPGKKKKSGAMVKTRSGFLNKGGALATKAFRMTPGFQFAKAGLKAFKGLKGFKIKNPFKKLKFKNPFKGGKGGGMPDEQTPDNPQTDEQDTQEDSLTDDQSQNDTASDDEDTQDNSLADEDQVEDSSVSDDLQSQDDSTGEDLQYQDDSDNSLGDASGDMAFTAASTALSFVPGGSAITGLLNVGKGAYDQKQQQKSTNKSSVSQSRLSFLQNLIKQNPTKPVVVVKQKPVPQIKKNNAAPVSTPRKVSFTQPVQQTEISPKLSAGTSGENNGMIIGLGVAAAIAAFAMSGKD